MRLTFTIIILICLLSVKLVAQGQLIKGNVMTQEDNQPLAGVNVVLKGSGKGALTDANGHFSLTASPGYDTLLVTMVGRRPSAVAIGNRTTMTIYLVLATTFLDEAIVIGYGSQARRELTGSVSSITAQQFSDVPLLSPDQALQGRAAGVLVTQSSGTPATSLKVRIRGTNSLNATAEPLYVVDGMPINTGDFSGFYLGGQSLNALSDLNPQDIASIQILKDAAAAAIYGSRASNGVVLITTKRGKSGPTALDIKAYEGVQSVPKLLAMLSGPEQEVLLNEQRTAVGLSPQYPDPANATTTNWQREVFRTAPIREYSLSASGGNQQTRFYLSGTYFRQQGIVLGSDFRRGSVRLNLDHWFSPKLQFGTSLTLSRALNNRINGDNFINGVLGSALFLGSHIPVRNPNGSYALDPLGSASNPVAEGTETQFDSRTNRVVGTAFAEYRFSPALQWRTNIGVDNLVLKEDVFYPTTTLNGSRANGSGRSDYRQNFNWLLESTLTYSTVLRQRHSFTALAGAGWQTSAFETLTASATNFPGNSISRLTAGSVKTGASSDGATWALTSFFSRLQYAFREKLLISATLRADGSSRFNQDRRYGVFPVGSIGWVLYDGKGQPNALLSFLKVRASYGLTGNANMGTLTNQTPALGLFGVGRSYLQQTSLVPLQLANPALSWEKTRELNLGVDVALIANRLSLSANYFIRRTNDLLQARQLPLTSGFSQINENIGSLQNRGVELEVSFVNRPQSQWQWQTSFNLSFIRNTVTKLYGGTPFSVGYANWVQEGQPVGAFYGSQVARIFQTQAEIDALNQASQALYGSTSFYQSANTRPGDIQFKDLNGDGRITSADQTVIGSAQPSFFGGLANKLTFRGLDVSLFLQFTYGNDIYNYTRSIGESMSSQYGQWTSVRNRWTPERPSTSMPRAAQGNPNNNTRISDRFIEDGSFLRLKNLAVGYTLRISQLRKARLRFYATAQNLLTFTHYTGYDPEVNTLTDQSLVAGSDFFVIPQARTFLVGIQLGF
ncbi:SusC/RagA family TonB-linked outer membrane protein [Spirosoma endbachense]|uniref:SusC/RagA family TonB-linked outer membrane protein n=1 Tax=Spirosoma endbachense TaxID=2666025 RepID=A0A6P1W6I4_9BACT|nr:TonB-dependent receptor [Spirosoma endbachense]QHW00179.1 SusC/RagA family TonB-linked outer membrane protein [Spirosoma endbachense]